MYFKMIYTVREMLAPKNQPVEFSYDEKRNTKVILRAPTDDEIKNKVSPTTLACEITCEIEPSPKIESVFQGIEKNEYEKLADEFGGKQSYADSVGNIITLPQLDKLPMHFVSFIDNIEGNLSDYAKRTCRVFRWRHGHRGPYNPFSLRSFSWSRDKGFWHSIPSRFDVGVHAISSIFIPDEIGKQIHQLVQNNDDEPIYHELYREAAYQHISNPRSALVMAIIAAEIGFKHLVGTLIPDANWLVTNIPSPPLYNMLKDYMPTLPVKNRINDAVKPPTDNILKAIQKGVQMRNLVVHSQAKIPKSDSVDEILDAVQDLLHLYDYYRGYEWSFEFISEETRNELLGK